MRAKITEHILSLVVVSAILLGLLYLFTTHNSAIKKNEKSKTTELANLDFVDFDDPFEKALFKDALNIFYPGQYDQNSTTIKAIEQYRVTQFNKQLTESYLREKLSWSKFGMLLKMYMKFILVYVIVLLLTYYGVQTLGVLRFVKKRQQSTEQLCTADGSKSRKKQLPILYHGYRIIKGCLKGLAYSILFSPAYVIAYSIRTEFNTDTTPFLILLAVVSNGLLITYTNKFYAFLASESRKGYVQTAIVKNLNNSYSHHGSDGISYKAILRPVKKFKGHVLEHIFRNAHYQYITTIKEQASFLITGLIIIEMALNIHGHLSYEMLRQILYRNYDIVIVIILGIFYTVKLTEITADVLLHKESLKYENKIV